eukprot:7726408-Pyramimonas_sp.AAC.1
MAVVSFFVARLLSSKAAASRACLLRRLCWRAARSAIWGTRIQTGPCGASTGSGGRRAGG